MVLYIVTWDFNVKHFENSGPPPLSTFNPTSPPPPSPSMALG